MQIDDYHWFLNHYDELNQKYGDCFLAIKDEQVLGSFSTFDEAVAQADAIAERGTYIIQDCKKNFDDTVTHIVTPLWLMGKEV